MKSEKGLVAYVEVEFDDVAFRKLSLLWDVGMIQDVENNQKVVVEGILESPGVDICFLAGFLKGRKMSCGKNVTIPIKFGKKTYKIPYKFVRKMVFRAK